MCRRPPRTWPTEQRWLLQAYWLLSGYGLRASRALGRFAGAVLATVLLMMGFGLPGTPARPYAPASGVIGDRRPELHRPFADAVRGRIKRG
ncbi:hypothetical protein HUT19_36695 [Streptomyces sp. NA02950]|uniref:hypothetical protein n=1 Tax=Streptomyces sp. NA02950 TaxID=2742137 RepID=UPI001591D400|nr:hypothetical protein [Streptomyces sp. NA02950]QKV96554.1 hypothetical protein HUT19_36695 [Streptomyces sp. NA02950]